MAAFPTVAVNCCVCPPYNVAVPGVTDTVTGGRSVIVAVADLLTSATDVAVTVAVACAATLAGAVYKPVALTVPAPVTLHVTPVFAAFVTVAVNCCPCPPYNVAVPGVTDTVTAAVGFTVTVAVADFVASATDVALTVTRTGAPAAGAV